MEMTQLETAIHEKARERATKRVSDFCKAFDAAWRILTGENCGFRFQNRDSKSAGGQQERAEVLAILENVASSQGGAYNTDPLKVIGWPDYVFAEEKKRVVDDILKATEAVLELADLRGEES